MQTRTHTQPRGEKKLTQKDRKEKNKKKSFFFTTVESSSQRNIEENKNALSLPFKIFISPARYIHTRMHSIYLALPLCLSN